MVQKSKSIRKSLFDIFGQSSEQIKVAWKVHCSASGSQRWSRKLTSLRLFIIGKEKEAETCCWPKVDSKSFRVEGSSGCWNGIQPQREDVGRER
jgi:hypothetical protein